MQKPCRNPGSRHTWLWALLPLLLAAALAVPLLEVDAFNGDEPPSLLAAGVLRPGPWSLADVWDHTAPRHAPGWPMLLSVWGRIAGWSEVTIRALSLFVGLLTLAWVYRTGRGMFAPTAGLLAALLLSASLFHLAYMARAGTYAMVAFCATLCLWCYWRIALEPRSPGRATQGGLLLVSIGLLWSHYFGALLLPVLGLFHLLFVPKNRRWLQPVFLLGLAALTTTLQIPLYLKGLDNTSAEDLGDHVLTVTGVLSRLVHNLTNGILEPNMPFGTVLAILLPLVLVVGTKLHLRATDKIPVVWLPVFVSAALLAVIIAVNEVLQVIVANRIRYLMPLWPLTALLAGAGLRQVARRHRQVVNGLLALWLILGVHLGTGSEFRLELGYFIPSDIHRIYRALGEQIPETDLLMIDKSALWTDSRRLYSNLLDQNFNALPVEGEFLLENIRETYNAYPYIWLLYPSRDGALIKDSTDAEGLVHCEPALDEWGFALERLARSEARCASDDRRLEFENNVRLTWSGFSLQDEILRFEAGLTSADDYLLAGYSMAVHVINPRSGERVAQRNVGAGPGAIVALSSEIDISALPPGDYELRVALYDWQTGARLIAHDLETGAIGDMHTLHRFRLD